jgi:chromosome segregation ATPase
MDMDMDVLTEGLQKAIAVVRAEEYTLNGQIVEYTQRLQSKVDVAYRSEERLGEELRVVTTELFEAQATLEAAHGELEELKELAKVNEAVASIDREQQGLEDELQQGRDELSARHAELQQVRNELQACSEGTNVARLHEEELEERLAGLQEAERTLQAELKEIQTALQGQVGVVRAKFEDAHAELAAAREELSKNERDLRGELAQVEAELGAAKAELRRRQKCCFRLRSKKGAAPKEVRAVLDC